MLQWLQRERLRRSTVVSRVLFWGFPVFLDLLLYLDPAGSGAAFQFSRLSFKVLASMLLSALLLEGVYLLLSLPIRRSWLAAIAMAVPLYGLYVADSFKLINMGMRISADDLAMVFDITELWSFKGGQGSGIPVTPSLFWIAGALAVYIFFLWYCSVRSPLHVRYKPVLAGVLAITMIIPLSVEGLATQMFDPQIEAYEQVSSHLQSTQPLNPVDCLIGSLYYDTLRPQLSIPQDEEGVRSVLAGYEEKKGSGITPDVVVIMSESFFDMGRIEGIELTEDLYPNLRRMQREGTGGEIVAPSFGGGTAATEFEVLSATSNRAQNNTKAPYKHIDGESPIWTFQDYFKERGYYTTYIHPYRSYFYGREDAFTEMGFDRLIFEDDFTVDIQPYERDKHMSDENFVEQIIACLEERGGQAKFIFATSMQNHSPFIDITEGKEDQLVTYEGDAITSGELEALNSYANGVQDTDAALGRLLDHVEQRSRPTVVLFFGDHQPLLEGYKKLNSITKENIYNDPDNLTTEFAIYTNFSDELPEQKCAADGQRISAFYLMPMMLDYLGMDMTPYMQFIEECRQALPVYSADVEVDTHDSDASFYRERLELLSFDRLLGEGYSISASDSPTV